MSSNTNIGNTPVNQGYVQLIHMGETGGIDGTLRALYDGDGTASDLLIASDKVKISTELYIGSKTLTEFVQDTVGAMFSSNTETNITVTYQDGDGTIDLVSSGEVTLTGSETLTNKTLASPIVTGNLVADSIDVAGDLTLDADGADIILKDGGTEYGRLSQILGGLTLRSGSSASNAVIFSTDGDAIFAEDVSISAGKTFTFDSVALTAVQISSESFADNDTSLMTSAAINDKIGTEVASLVDSAPGTLNTLNELAAALGDDANFATTTATSLGEKLVKSSNLSDLTNAGTARSNLGLGSVATTSADIYLRSNADDTATGDLTLTGVVNNTNNLNVDGPNFNVSTTNKTTAEYAYRVDRSGSVVGGILIDGGFSTTGSITLGGHAFNDIDIGSEFTDADDHIMSAGAIKEKIEDYGYTTNVGDITGVDLTSGAGITISSETNTTSGAYSSTIATNIASTSLNVSGTGQLAINLNKSALSTATLNASDFMILFDANDSEAPKRFIAQDIFDTISGAVTSYTNTGDNRVLTSVGGTTINGESNLTFDGTNLDLPNSKKIRLGDSQDLEIYHDGTNSVINNTQTGALQIYNNVDNGMVELLTDNGSGGTQVFLRADGANNMVRMPVDGVKFTLGDASDLQLYHDGSNNYLRNNTTDQDFKILVNDGGSTITAIQIDASNYGRVILPNANQKLTIGAGYDLNLYNNGSVSYIANSNNTFNIDQSAAATMQIRNLSSDQDILFSVNDGGSQITALQIDASNVGQVKLPNDNQYLSIGEGSDLRMRHNGSNSFIENITGHFFFDSLGHGKKMQFATEDSSGTKAYVLNITGDNHRVGIGTTSPDAKLEVVGGNLRWKSTDDANTGVQLYSSNGNRQLAFYGYLTSYSALQSDNTSTFKIIQNNADGDIQFLVRPSSTNTQTEALRIDGATANVGIGTSSPTQDLTIFEDSGDCNVLISSANGASQVFFGDDEDDNIGIIRYDHGSNFMKFTTNTGDAMTIDSSQNVGIGTTSPDAKLEVVDDNGIHLTAATGGRTLIIKPSPSGAVHEFESDNTIAGYAFSNNAGELMRINSSGNLGIGTNSPTDTLQVEGSIGVGVGRDAQLTSVNNGLAIRNLVSNADMFFYVNDGGVDTEAMRIDGATANVGIGTTSPGYKLDVAGDARITSGSLGVGVTPNATDGRGDFSNDVVAYSTSDKRLKENIKPLDSALDKVLQISGVEFDWKELTKEEKKTIHGNEGHDVGVIAQEIEEVLPEVVTTRDTGYKAVKYEKIVPLLIEAIKEQQQQIEELKNG